MRKRVLKRSYVPAVFSLFAAGFAAAFSLTPERPGRHDVPEGSGIVASRRFAGVYWSHGDSGTGPYLYAFDRRGKRIARFRVTGASNYDWEDIALDEENHLWIGDIGDNPPCTRTDFKLYRFPEPDPFAGETATQTAVKYRFRYPDGGHDSEAFFVWRGGPYIVEKRTGSSSRARFYKFPEPLDSSSTVTLELLCEFRNGGRQITGADISEDGRRLTLVADGANRHWVIARSKRSTTVADFCDDPYWSCHVEFSNEQGEAICFDRTEGNGYDVLVISEQGGFWRIPQSAYEAPSPVPPEVDLSAELLEPPAGEKVSGPVRFFLHAAADFTELSRLELLVRPAALVTTYVDRDFSWQYEDSGSEAPASWAKPEFDALGWPEGYSPFGYGGAQERAVCNTVLRKGDPTIPTYYFRRFFDLDDLSAVNFLEFSIDFDDGFIMYLNGREIVRRNVAGSDYTTWASSVHNWSGDGASPRNPWFTYRFGEEDLKILRCGANLLAVEVHQQSATSSDVLMQAVLRGGREFEEKVAASKDLEGTDCTIEFELDLEPGEYLWNCRVYDTAGESVRAQEDRLLRVGDPASSSGAAFLRGDVNQDGFTDLSDTVVILEHLYGKEECIRGCRDAYDVNDDGSLDIGDVIYILQFLYAGGPCPPAPFPGAGKDPTEDDLLCAEYVVRN